jgi:hypothetical protein
MLGAVVVDDCEEILVVGEGVDEQQEQWDRLQRRLARRPQARKCLVADLCQAYEEATGTWTGCD